MKFSVWPSFARPWNELTDFVRATEAQGWHGLWYADHYMSDRPDGAPSDEPALECWAGMAGMAAITSRLRLGTLVSPTTMHHPALLAKRAASVDQISNGRVILGMGAGWQVNEHKSYGVDLFGVKDRVDRFEEAISIVSSLLSQQRTTFAGKHFQITDAPCEPKPVQSPLPILVGTSGPRMSRIVARTAQEWNVWGTPETVATASLVMNRACESEGRDPSTLRRSTQALVFIVDDSDVAAKIRSGAPADRALVGSPAELADRINEYAASGIDEFILPDFTLGKDAAQRRESYDRFWAEVVPNVG
jgi:probable F420-dependent oxidoreductase